MTQGTLLVAIGNESVQDQILQSLAQESSVGYVWETFDPRNWLALLDRIATLQPQSVLLDVDFPQGDLASAIREIRTRSEETKIIAAHPSPDAESILGAMRAGASEFIHAPFSESLFSALERIAQTAKSSRKNGKLVAFLSAKGGCGATTLACHIAPELQKQTAGDVLLADFDFTSGVVGFLMKTNSSYSVLDAVKNLSRLDESLWKALVTRQRPAFSILPAPAAIAHGEYPDEQDFKQVLRFMRSQHDWTVIDLGRSLTRTARVVLDEVDQLFLVSTLEVIALHGVKNIVRGVAAESANSGKLNLILNRTPKMMDITLDELQKILGKPIYASLPNDYPGLYHSYASGTLLPSNSRLAGHFLRLTCRIAGKPEPKLEKKRFALF